MSEDNGGGNSPPVVEIGDAPDLTRVMKPDPTGYQYRNTSTKKMVVASWSSLEVFASQFKGDHGEKWWARHNVRRDWNPSWNGCDSFDEALDLAIHGWAEGGETIERTRGYIRALNPLSPRLIKYGIAGTTPNVPRAIAGNILNMRVPETGKSRKKQIITIVYNMCENGGISSEAITNKAAVAAALIDEIEAKGFAVEVVSAVATDGYTGSGIIKAYEFVRIKESHHPIDINRLAFGLGHSAMFRGLFFADMQRNHEFREIGEGLGCATSSYPTKELSEDQTYIITSAGGKMGLNPNLFSTVDKAVKEGLDAMVRELQRQGCPAFPKLTEKDHEDDLAKSEEDEEELPVPHWSY